MNFLNRNKFFTERQQDGIEKFVGDINSGRYNEIGKIVPRNFNMIEVGYQSGWLSFYVSQQTTGKVYAIDFENNITPSLKETVKFNKITNLNSSNKKDLIGELKNHINSYEINFIVLNSHPTLLEEVCEVAKEKKVPVFKLIGASFVLVNKSDVVVSEPKKRKTPNAANKAQKAAMDDLLEKRKEEEEVRVEKEKKEIEELVEGKKKKLVDDAEKLSTSTQAIKPKAKRKRRARKTTE